MEIYCIFGVFFFEVLCACWSGYALADTAGTLRPVRQVSILCVSPVVLTKHGKPVSVWSLFESKEFESTVVFLRLLFSCLWNLPSLSNFVIRSKWLYVCTVLYLVQMEKVVDSLRRVVTSRNSFLFCRVAFYFSSYVVRAVMGPFRRYLGAPSRSAAREWWRESSCVLRTSEY